jgi:renal tumor antigen
MLDNLLSNFALIKKIGEGSFSEVLKVKEKRTGKYYAAKRLTKYYGSIEEVFDSAELKTLQKIEYHPNILSLVDFAFEPQNGALTLIFDLMEMSLYDFIKERNKKLSESRCKNFLFQLTLGLNHLHRSGIFHRDIKPENILIKTDPRLKSINPLRCELIQIGDLGSVCYTDFPLPHSAYISTRWYRAPECLLTSGYYGPKMDVWALGCVFFEILTLSPLFPGDNELDQLYKIHEILGTPSEKLLERFKECSIDFEFPKRKPQGIYNLVPFLSEYGVDILKKTLTYHPDMRISAKKLLEHIYFKDIGERNRTIYSANRLLTTTSLGENKSEGLSSRGSSEVCSSSSSSSAKGKSFVLKKLHEAQDRLNKQMERGWGMNACPQKVKIISTIKSSVQNTRKVARCSQ